MNQFIGEGNLGQDPEIRTVQGRGEEQTVARLRVYFDRRRPDGEGGFKDERGFWLDVELWGERAAQVARLCRKGHRLAVRGSLVDDSYQKDEKTIVRLAVRARQVYLVPSAKLERLHDRGEIAA